MLKRDESYEEEVIPQSVARNYNDLSENLFEENKDWDPFQHHNKMNNRRPKFIIPAAKTVPQSSLDRNTNEQLNIKQNYEATIAQPSLSTWLPGDEGLPPFSTPQSILYNMPISPSSPVTSEFHDNAVVAVTVDHQPQSQQTNSNSCHQQPQHTIIEGELYEDEEELIRKQKRARRLCVCLFLLFFLVLIITAISVPISIQRHNAALQTFNNTPTFSFSPTLMPSHAPTSVQFQEFLEYIISSNISSKSSFQKRSSPQYQALQWISASTSSDIFSSSSFEQEKSLTQKYVLAVFYYSTNGDSWTNCHQYDPVCVNGKSSYLSLENHECYWYGNICNKNNEVVTLQFASASSSSNLNRNLNGVIPHEISHLSQLTKIFLANNPKLHGTIPSSFAHLKNLKELFLYRNQLTSPIPTELFQMKNLEIFSIAGNKFHGSLPSQFSYMPSLKKLVVSYNSFSGSIPSQLGNSVNLTTFIGGGNRFTGSISFSLFQNLHEFYAGSNQLTGTIPNVTSTNMKRFQVFNNSLTGTIPESLFNSLTTTTALRLFNISNNLFHGEISTKFGLLKDLLYLSLDENKLYGTIPKELANLSNCSVMKLHGNNFTGTVSKSICALRKNSLQVLSIDCRSKVSCSCCTSCF